MSPKADAIETHTLSVLVDNEPGVLAGVIGVVSGRGDGQERRLGGPYAAARPGRSVPHRHRGEQPRPGGNVVLAVGAMKVGLTFRRMGHGLVPARQAP